MLISSAIPNLFNGISQQPASLRHPSQAELQENGYSSIATGLRKRPPTIDIARLTAASYPNAFVHTINRDAVERYTVLLVNGDLFVYDFAGVAKVVNFPDGKGYLNCGTPRSDFAVVTVADYTFILNKTVVTAMNVVVTAGAITGTKQKFSELPAPTGTDNIWRIAGDPTNNFDDYYVKDSAAAGSVWTEHTKPGITYSFNAATMPFKLVRNAGGDFTFSKSVWTDRNVGDDNSNPVPSFIGRKLKDIYFHRNRLGITADESFVMSRSGDYANYWIQTVTAIIDTDPVDRDLSHTKVSIINYAVPFSKAMVLFSDSTQFQLSSGDTLTPKSVKADPITEFESSAQCRPTPLGTALFFAQQRGGYTGVREYFVDLDTISNDAADVTAHCPTYIPADTYLLAGCSNEDTLFALSMQERNAIYVYKFYWGKQEKLQSAWSKYTFPATDTILNASFIGTTCYLTIQRAEGIFFESMDLQTNAADTGFAFQILLDRRKSLLGVYDATNNWTTWTLPYADSEVLQVILGAAFGNQKGTLLTITRPSPTTIRAAGDYSVGTCFVGRKYVMRYRLSELYYRDQKSGAIQSGRLQLSRMYLVHDKSGYFRVEVTPKARETYTYPFTGKVLGDSTLVLGSPALSSGKFLFPIRSNNLGCRIDIVNDSHLPSTLQSAEWEGDFVAFTSRVP